MPLKVDCPRCKQLLAVPRKKAGAYVICPRCNGRLWVPEEAAANAASGDTTVSGEFPAPGQGSVSATSWPTAASIPSGSGTPPSTIAGSGGARSTPSPMWAAAPSPVSIPLAPPASQPPLPGMSPQVPPVTPPSNLPPRPVPMAPAVPAAVPERPKRTARFIAAEAAASAIQPAADGKLPELRLDEGQEIQAAEAKGVTVNPLVLLGVLCLSVVLSVMAVLVDFEDTGGGDSRRKAEARAFVETNYFSGMDKHKPLEPYQIYLREAQQAFARGDRRTERQMYRKVLELLQAERGTFERGLTGSRSNDKALEQRLVILLGNH